MYYLTSGAIDLHVERDVSFAGASLRIGRLNVLKPVSAVLTGEDEFVINMNVKPPPEARLSFRESWPKNRFERTGRLFIVPPFQSADLTSPRGIFQYVECRLQPALFARALESDSSWPSESLFASLNVSNPNIMALMGRLSAEIRKPNFGTELMCEAIAVELAVELARYYRGTAKDTSKSGTLSPARLTQIDERLRDFMNPPTLAELAELCNLSLRQLARGFRMAKGISLGAHINEVRLMEARRRLLAQERVKTVAHAVGFRSASSFSHAFRVATGQSPRDFQRFPNGAGRH